jgi:hypothetical protein
LFLSEHGVLSDLLLQKGDDRWLAGEGGREDGEDERARKMSVAKIGVRRQALACAAPLPLCLPLNEERGEERGERRGQSSVQRSRHGEEREGARRGARREERAERRGERSADRARVEVDTQSQ